MANALAKSSSPYLRQHADNPVDWVEWGPAAFEEARRRDVPVLISIGYATCHWCHVMAHESFEDADTAALMNRLFVCIKVDREELPEVDEIYMDAVQALHGNGGWPLNAFADHHGRPFFAATYFPRDRWQEACSYLAGIWTTDRERVIGSARELTMHLARYSGARPTAVPKDLPPRVRAELERSFDVAHPGFGQQPKFPPSQSIIQALRVGDAYQRERAIDVLQAMQDSGLHDRVGGGFHRYAVDRVWRVPHFEKMLYDNAQLALGYALAAALTKRPDFTRTALAIGDYLLRDMRVSDRDGAFLGYASGEDADDPGGEGSFYAWSPDALRAVVGPGADAVIKAWDLAPGERHIGPSGHLEPVTQHIPHPRARDLGAVAVELGYSDAQALRASWDVHLAPLRIARSTRPRPIRDDKVLTDLNGLTLAAFSVLARLCNSSRARDAAEELVAVLKARHTAAGLQRLPGRAAYITDYGHLALGLVEAHKTFGDPSLIAFAATIIEEAVARLAASPEEGGGFFTTPSGRGDLIRRSREHHDGSYPAGQHALALAAVELYALCDDAQYRALADNVFRVQAKRLEHSPLGCPTLLHALLLAESQPIAVVVAGSGKNADEMLAFARAQARPLTILPTARHEALDWPLLEARKDLPAQALVCVGTRCLLPAFDVAELGARLATVTDAAGAA